MLSLLLESHLAVLLQRVALISGENAPDEDVLEVLNDVTEWLSSQSNDLSSVSDLFSYGRCFGAWHCARIE